jgi:hypothetical protein
MIGHSSIETINFSKTVSRRHVYFLEIRVLSTLVGRGRDLNGVGTDRPAPPISDDGARHGELATRVPKRTTVPQAVV